jgi:uncharacterized protein YcfL
MKKISIILLLFLFCGCSYPSEFHTFNDKNRKFDTYKEAEEFIIERSKELEKEGFDCDMSYVDNNEYVKEEEDIFTGWSTCIKYF